MEVRAEFLRAIRAAGCLQPGDTAVLGVSGGADSLAMLHLFASAADDLGVRPRVLHLNHHIRGVEADADAAFVARVCREWGIDCHIAEADVPALARRDHLALEEAARQARYRALAEEALRAGARVIAVAHNADDQAETVLMHFLRGSGLAGLRGMLPATPLGEFHFLDLPPASTYGPPLLLRPLLGVPRADIEAYCADHKLVPRLDHTNLDTTYFRNRLRREVIPLLESIAPGLRTRLGQTAQLLAADHQIVMNAVNFAWGQLFTAHPSGRIRFDLYEWGGLPLSTRRGLLRKAIKHLRADLRDISFDHIEHAIRVAHDGGTGAIAVLPGGLVLRVDYDAIIVSSSEDKPTAPGWPLLDPGANIHVDRPSQIDLPSGWRFHLSPYTGARSGPNWDALLADPWSAALSLPAGGDLYLRARRPGDRFQPQGAGGTQKVNEFMINARIPVLWRDRLPLLVAGGQIAWLCGWRVDQRFVVTPEIKGVWLARFETA